MEDRLLAVHQHAKWSTEWKGERSGLIEMRQHYNNYFRGIPHFKEYKKRFLEIFTLHEMEELMQQIREQYADLEP